MAYTYPSHNPTAGEVIPSSWGDDVNADLNFLQIRSCSMEVVYATTALTTGDGKQYFVVPANLNGYELTACIAVVYAKSSSGTPTIQIARGRQANPASAFLFVDMLSTLITIDANEYSSEDATTAYVINTSNDDIATGDLIRVDVDVAGTATTGLYLTLTFEAPE